MQKPVFILICHCLLQATLLFGQTEDENRYREVEENFLAQLEVYPHEKIHIHSDRDFYIPGEKIMFKAYVIDAVTHQYPTYSMYVYVELIDTRDTLVSRVMIRRENNMFCGHLLLPENIPEGNYTLRAYTRYMENLGDDYFFKKNIRVGGRKNAESGNQNNEENSNHSGNLMTPENHVPDYDVSFFPEGGNLIDGVLCRVAFKALNRNGYSETLSGEIVNETDTEITSVKTLHAGMGVFGFIPEMGKRYFLKCRNETGLEKKFELPQPDPRAYSLTATQRNKMITIGLQKSDQSPDSPCYLLVQSRAGLLYFAAWDYTSKAASFTAGSLPSGIIQFFLFDQQMNPLSERLVFNKNDDAAKVVFHTDKGIYTKREKVIPTLTVSDVYGNRLNGHLSIAVTDDKDIPVDSSTTILSTLLCSSELKGYIENPAWYLQDNNQSSLALDYLMMTHGWRRYNIPEVVKGNPEYPHIPFQTSQRLSGSVKNLLLSKPIADCDIAVLTEEGIFGITTTDRNGAFLFDNCEYSDSTSFFMQVMDKKESNKVALILNPESFPAPVHAPQNPGDKNTKSEFSPNAIIAKAELRSMYDDSMREYNLSEVVVTAPRIEKRDESRLQFWANAKSDVTIRREEIEKYDFIHVSDYLRLIPGVQFKKGVITIRGGGTLNPKPPLILVDGSLFNGGEIPGGNFDSLNDLSVYDIESIDVFKGANAAVFGARGLNGVISITTRRAKQHRRMQPDDPDFTVFTPFGYQKPTEFYAPRYETNETPQSPVSDFRTTIFWKPDVIISDAGEASFEFYTADFPTTYSVVIEGITGDGKIVRQVERIQVR